MKHLGSLIAAGLCSALLVACSSGGAGSLSIPSGEAMLSGAPQRETPTTAIAAFGRTLYVANLGDGSGIPSVTVYAQGKSYLRTIAQGINDPRTLAIGVSGRLFVGNRERSRHGGGTVTVYGLRGKELMRTIPHIYGPQSMVFDVVGNLYVAVYGAVRVFAPGGKIPVRIISKGLSRPQVLAIDAAGNLYVAGYDRRGGSIVSVYAPGEDSPHLIISDGIDVPTAMVFDADGNLYVANSYAPGYGCGIGTVTVYAPGSSTILRTISDGVCMPESLAFDSSGNLYVGNIDKNGVTVYAPGSSTVLRTITDSVNTAESMAFDQYGNLYVANLYGYTSTESGSVTVYAPGSNSLLRTITRGISYPLRLVFGP